MHLENNHNVSQLSPETLIIQTDTADKLSLLSKSILFCVMNPPECMHRYIFTAKGNVRNSKHEHDVFLNYIRNRLLGRKTVQTQKEFNEAVKEIQEFVASFPN